MFHRNTPPMQEDLRRLYIQALDAFLMKVKQDRYIVAAILYGSLAYDDIWEKSDIDIMLLTRDDKTANHFYTLVEQGICIHVEMGPRSDFKTLLERSLQGSMMQSIMERSTLLFSTDETLKDYYRTVHHVGTRDRELQLLKAASYVLPSLTKAEKWLTVKKDPTYSFLWLMFLMNHLATVEVLLQGGVAGREVIKQALSYNSTLFTTIYTDLVNTPKDETRMRAAIALIAQYLEEKIPLLFKPVLQYLAKAGGTCTTTEINDYLQKKAQFNDMDVLTRTYEWLAEKGVIQQTFTPLRLTGKSHITVDEAAYYYDGEDTYETDDKY